jgi:hypothetical protein
MEDNEHIYKVVGEAVMAAELAKAAHQLTLTLLYGLMHGQLDPEDYIVTPEGWADKREAVMVEEELGDVED